MEYSLATPQYPRRRVPVTLTDIKIHACSSPLYKTMQCLVYNWHLSTLYLKLFLDCSNNQPEQGKCFCSFVLFLHVYTTHLCVHTCECANTHLCRGQDRLARTCLYHFHLIASRPSLCWTPSSPGQLDWLASKLSEPICLFPPLLWLPACAAMPSLALGPADSNTRLHAYKASALTHWVISGGPVNKFYCTFLGEWW